MSAIKDLDAMHGLIPFHMRITKILIASLFLIYIIVILDSIYISFCADKFKKTIKIKNKYEYNYIIKDFLKYFPEARIYYGLGATNSIDICYTTKNTIFNPFTEFKINFYGLLTPNGFIDSCGITSGAQETGDDVKPDKIYYRNNY